MFEIIRVTKTNHTWQKNTTPLDFPMDGITVPGSDRKYKVIGTCNHRGSLRSGHWYTNLRMSNNQWFEVNDLGKHKIVPAPGNKDSSTVLVALIAKDKLATPLLP